MNWKAIFTKHYDNKIEGIENKIEGINEIIGPRKHGYWETIFSFYGPPNALQARLTSIEADMDRIRHYLKIELTTAPGRTYYLKKKARQ